MKHTLDCIALIEACYIEKYKDKSVFITPFTSNNLADFSSQDNISYFGVLALPELNEDIEYDYVVNLSTDVTVSAYVDTGIPNPPYLSEEKNQFVLDKNSMISMLFESLEIRKTNEDNTLYYVDSLPILFYGYQIHIKEK